MTLLQTIFLSYLVLANLVTFAMYGIDKRRSIKDKWRIPEKRLLLAALLAGCAVSLAGLLSFVGLLIPHAIRRVAGSKASNLMGLSALYGAGFVCLCDTLARTVFSPYEIPVGIIMAFLGAPFFVFILIKGKGGHSRD